MIRGRCKLRSLHTAFLFGNVHIDFISSNSKRSRNYVCVLNVHDDGTLILLSAYPLLSKDSVNTFPQEPKCATIGHFC
jgi:hypothetical protein